MVTPVWRPERRNRNTGTRSAGYRKPNEMRIPESWVDRDGVARPYHSRVSMDGIREFSDHECPLTVLYEQPYEGCSYGCTPSDVLHVLKHIPAHDREGLNLVAFRQPTRKQQALNPVWGRLLYDADFGRHKGPAIVLESINTNLPVKWPKKMDIESQKELQRLRDDGHVIEVLKRGYLVHLTEPSLRQTMLYRTLLHEVGHWVHWLTSVIRPQTALSSGRVEAIDQYFSKSGDEREQFAHRYVTELARDLRAQRVIPFGQETARQLATPLSVGN